MLNQNPNLRIFYSAISYGIVMSLFINALVNPMQNINFIYNVGIFIFVTEFLGIHSTVMLTNSDMNRVQKLMPLAVYLLFVIIISLATHTFYPAVIFALTLIAKLFQKGSQGKQIFIPLFVFLGTTFFVSLSPALISGLIKMPQEVLDHKPLGSSGLFVDQPQTLMVWGILYYLALMIAAIWPILKSRNA